MVFVRGGLIIVWKPQGEARRTLTPLSDSEVIVYIRRRNTVITCEGYRRNFVVRSELGFSQNKGGKGMF